MNFIALDDVLKNFTLKEDSPFAILVQSLLTLFEHQIYKSTELQNTFAEWKLHSKERLPEKIPRTWKYVFKEMSMGNEQKLNILFCIETLLVITFKYILAIVAQNHQLPISLKISQKDSISHVIKLIDIADKHLLYSVAYERKFNWWFEPYEELLNEKIASEKARSIIDKLNESLMSVLKLLEEISLSQDIDILGELYQHVVDVKIRKAFGEFYTPLPVVKLILDSVGYAKGNQLRKKTLLDPACGSGSFLVEALKRYISDVKEEAEIYGWSQVLEELCNNLRIWGLDLNPFSCLMAKVRFVVELLPYYVKAIQSNPSFLIPKPPIFCSDFLLESEFTENSIDFIIGNPPYVGVTQIPKEKRRLYQRKFRTSKGRLNLYILFIERAINLLKTNGMLGFLVPTAFMVYSGYGKALREYILEHCNIKIMINLALCKSVFKQDVSIGIFVFQKMANSERDERLTSVILKTDELHSLESITLTEQDTSRHSVMMFPQSLFYMTQENIFSPFLGEIYYSLIKKMEDGNSFLGDLFRIEQCIRIGSAKTRKLVLISEEKYKSLISAKQKHYRRIINGIDITRFNIDWKNIYLKYEPETDDERLYLAKNPSIFEREKLFFRNTSKFLTVAYDGGDDSKAAHEQYYYALNTLYTLHLKKPDKNKKTLTKYALAYLNSPLAEFYYRVMYWGLIIPGGSIKYRECIKYVPFKLPENSKEESIIKEIVINVEKILEAQPFHSSDIDNSLLKRINTSLFILYNLNSSEIEQINNFLTSFCPSWPADMASKNHK